MPHTGSAARFAFGKIAAQMFANLPFGQRSSRPKLAGHLLAGWTRLVGGNALAGILQLLALAILARALDLAVLGMVVLVHTYVRVVDRLVNFQSVGVLTRYLSEAEQQGDPSWFAGLVKAGLLVDLGAALLAGLVGAALVPVLGPMVGIGPEWLWPAALYCLIIPSRILGVTEAVLRNFNHFTSIAMREAGQALLRVLGTLVAWIAGADGMTFLLIWFASELIANLAVIARVLQVLRQRGIALAAAMPVSAALRRAQEFWPSLWHSNLAASLRMLSQDCDVMLAGALFGAAGAGLLRIAKNVGNVLYQVGHPLTQVASAPIARMVARGGFLEALTFSRRISLSAFLGALGLTVLAVAPAEAGMALLFGEAFRPAADLALLMMLARSFYLAGIVNVPFKLALGLGHRLLPPVLLASAVYAVSLFVAVPLAGLTGFALAQVAYDLVWSVVGWVFITRHLRHMEGGRHWVLQ